MSHVCLSLTGTTLSENIDRIERNRQWIDVVELRADFLEEGELRSVGSFAVQAGIPALLTVRLPKDGGHWAHSEGARQDLLIEGIESGFSFVDLEGDLPLERVREKALRASLRIVSSLHDFTGVPGDLIKTLRALKRTPGDIPKIACHPNGVSELFDLIDACKTYNEGDMILIGMGSFGFPTRVLAQKLGVFLTFTSVGGDTSIAAPGHVTPQEMVELYRFKDVEPDWEIFGIIADPVAHSKSPHIHNPAFAETGARALYVPFRVDDVGEFFRRCRTIDLKGVSVTIPHKESVIAYLDHADEFVREIGSCNTVCWDGDQMNGLNTDAPGFLAALRPLLGDTSLQGLRASVIGAGGTARAVCSALRSAGCKPLIFNRTPQRAEHLARDFGLKWHTLDGRAAGHLSEHSDLIVQTTSVGMTPNTEMDPIPFYRFSGREMVYDVIYSPVETTLLKRAREAGCRGLNGWGMLLEQAYLQFSAFTGKEYPKHLTNTL